MSRPRFSAALAATVVTGCWTGASPLPAMAQPGERRPPRFTLFRPDRVPRLDGSRVAEPLTQAMVIQGVSWSFKPAPALGLARRDFFVPDDLSQHEIWRTQVLPRIVHHGTSEAYASLVRGDSDLIVVIREPTHVETEAATEAGVELEVRPIAWEAIAMIVHPDNPAQMMDRDQVQQVYSGQPMSWHDVGEGNGAAIVPLACDDDSESHTMFVGLVMGDEPVNLPARPPVADAYELINAVSKHRTALGYAPLHYLNHVMRGAGEHDVKTLAIGTVTPDAESIADGSYPLRTPVYAVIRSDAGETVREFRDWMLGIRGERAIRAAGYVPYKQAPPEP